MRWILEHLNLIIVIAGAVAWWLNQRAREKAGSDADYDQDGVPEARKRETFEDPDLAERTRKIREDIERRIAERRRAGGGYTEPVRPGAAPLQPPAPAPAPPPPVIRIPGLEPIPVPVEKAPPVIREVVVKQSAATETRRMAEILEQQAALAEQLQQAEELRAAAKRRIAFEASTADRETAARVQARDSIVDDLRDPRSVRRAFLMREILGPPVALRR